MVGCYPGSDWKKVGCDIGRGWKYGETVIELGDGRCNLGMSQSTLSLPQTV
ncbi:hypothetical protein DPMN_016340 [Dreissena polymorpha]|uniref:Uncharacterized protein n=1 Tax=Dreissena polymorpha TaxID=45954 RepID=A0A9D4NDC5_DREPO|nr:hypothetical protein DPMN_016340 [Dreissena polymorpha]